MNVYHVAGAAIFAAFAGLISGCTVNPYNCPANPSMDATHCFATVDWHNPGITGATMTMNAVELTSGDNFINDEMWVIDESKMTGNGPEWVEVGETNKGPGEKTQFLVAFNNLKGFQEVLGPDVPEQDIQAGALLQYTISRDADPMMGGLWNVTISRAADGSVIFTGAAPVPMSPDTVQEGTELVGFSGAHAPFVFFSNNAVLNGTVKTFQTTEGTVRSNDPPHGGWWGGREPENTTTGGQFFTSCCGIWQ